MIEPGTPLQIEACGQTFESVVLSRRQQRQLLKLVADASKLEPRVESIDKLYDILDEVIEICLPGATETLKDRLQFIDVLEIANSAIAANMVNATHKKKSESPLT